MEKWVKSSDVLISKPRPEKRQERRCFHDPQKQKNRSRPLPQPGLLRAPRLHPRGGESHPPRPRQKLPHRASGLPRSLPIQEADRILPCGRGNLLRPIHLLRPQSHRLHRQRPPSQPDLIGNHHLQHRVFHRRQGQILPLLRHIRHHRWAFRRRAEDQNQTALRGQEDHTRELQGHGRHHRWGRQERKANHESRCLVP